MKFPNSIIILMSTVLLLSSSGVGLAQCVQFTTTTACTSPAPTVVGASVACTPPANNGGQRNFVVTGMLAGCTYSISNCGSGFDTQLTVFNAAGVAVGYNDDNGPLCLGAAASLNFVCPADGNYSIQLNRFNCATANNLNGTITVTLVTCAPPPPCSNCTTATPITSLPFNGSYTTCGACNSVISGNGCTSNYLGGEDYLFSYTPTVTGAVDIVLSNTLTFTGVFITQGCPLSGGTCVNSATNGGGNPSIINQTLTAGVTYYIIVDTWPPPNCTPFTINITPNIPDPNAYIISNSTVSTCSGTFYDSGSNGGNYLNNENYTYTLCSNVSGNCIRLDFLTFNTEAGLDQLFIYDGPNTLGNLLGTYSGTTIPPSVISTTGCITFRFVSDGSVTRPGWSAAISCAPCGGGPCAQTCSGGPPPANDACSGAQNLGTLAAPGPCPGGLGTLQTWNTTNLCATAESPYSSLLGCQPLGNQANPAADVWYRFNITAPVLNVVVTGLSTPNIAIYEGINCGNLAPRGCAIGGAGVLNTTFQGLAAGTYYLQVSGGDLVDQCDFTLSLRNSYDCAGCVIQSSFTANPEPINGQYPANTTVNFCYTITSYNQTSANWLHGVVPTFGPGWNPATLTVTAPPACSGNGFWAWYPGTVTSTATGTSYGPGFFFETAAGGGTGSDGNPGNNFGDNNLGVGNPPVNPCTWTFCWTITTDPQGACVQDANLNIAINTLGDGESGSWGSFACSTDPVSTFFAQLNCCPPPIVSTTPPLCVGQSNGSATVTGQGTGPWTYVLRDVNGVVVATVPSTNGSAIFNGLAAGSYSVDVTDAASCLASQNVNILNPTPLVVNVTPLAPSVCSGSSVTLTASGATSYSWSPATGLSSTTGATVTANPTATTIYTVTGTSGSCTATQTVTVTISNPVTATISYSGSPFCTDVTTSQLPIIVGSTGGIFSAAPAGLSINSLTGAILPSSSTAGNYTISYTLAASGSCPAFVTTTTVTITALPTPPVLTPTNPCANTAVVFTASGGTTFEFFVNGVSQGPSSTLNTYNTSGLPAGTVVCVRNWVQPPFVMNGLISEPQWGTPLATSSGGPTTSGFGANNRVDALFLKNYGGKLYGAIAGNENDGNDQANNNWIIMFIDSKPGGFNNLAAWTNRSNSPTNTRGVSNLALFQNVIFDAGFNADYILTMNQASATAYFDLYHMTANVNTFLGSNVSNPSDFGFAGNLAVGDVSRGFEFSIPLSLLGSPASSISTFVMMVNDPNVTDQTFVSNQFITRANAAQGNFGNGLIDFNSEPPSPVLFPLSADCYEETCVTVQPPIVPTFNPLPLICYGDTPPLLTNTSLNGITGTWSPTVVSNTSNGTYTFTPTPPQCASPQTLNVNVNPQVSTSPLYHD
ncbi:MAG: CUB domain-containing protein [Flavobacteriales bacterium]